MSISIEPIRGVTVGSYGQTITLTVVDRTGTVQDLSDYDSDGITVIGVSPSGRKTVTATGSFVSDGSDGQVSFSWADGDIDVSGKWKAQIELTTATELFKTRTVDMDVAPSLRDTP